MLERTKKDPWFDCHIQNVHRVDSLTRFFLIFLDYLILFSLIGLLHRPRGNRHDWRWWRSLGRYPSFHRYSLPEAQAIDGQANLIVRLHGPIARVENRDSLDITWEPVNCSWSKAPGGKHQGHTSVVGVALQFTNQNDSRKCYWLNFIKLKNTILSL